MAERECSKYSLRILKAGPTQSRHHPQMPARSLMIFLDKLGISGGTKKEVCQPLQFLSACDCQHGHLVLVWGGAGFRSVSAASTWTLYVFISNWHVPKRYRTSVQQFLISSESRKRSLNWPTQPPTTPQPHPYGGWRTSQSVILCSY